MTRRTDPERMTRSVRLVLACLTLAFGAFLYVALEDSIDTFERNLTLAVAITIALWWIKPRWVWR